MSSISNSSLPITLTPEQREQIERLLADVKKAKEDHLQDPVYYEKFTDPIGLQCGHIFNRRTAIRQSEVNPTCPLCRAPFKIGDFVENPKLSSECKKLTEELEQRFEKIISGYAAEKSSR